MSFLFHHGSVRKSLYLSIKNGCQLHVHVYLGYWPSLREVKMAGYWPSSFSVFMDRDKVEVREQGKKNEANIQPSWPPSSLVSKGFIIWDKMLNPARSGSQSQHTTWFMYIMLKVNPAMDEQPIQEEVAILSFSLCFPKPGWASAMSPYGSCASLCTYSVILYGEFYTTVKGKAYMEYILK